VTFRRLHLWLPPLLYMAVIFHFSSESHPLPELTALVWDKLLHTIEYGGLGLLMCRALLGEGISRAKAALLALIVASMYGVSDEWHQAFVPFRSSDVLDWVADTIGSVFGVAVMALLPQRPRR
jgi:VanZ family protein